MNKGFTLIELLGVIVLLGVLAAIVTVSVGTVINNSKNSLSDIQKKKIEEAAETYYLREGMGSIDYEAETDESCVNVSLLIEKGYFENNAVIDPANNDEMTGSVKITYSSNQYKYEYQETECVVAE